MAQNNNIAMPVKRYTRADFTALRAYLSKIPVDRIQDLYYHEDDLAAMGCESVHDLERWLDDMCVEMSHRAQLANPHLAAILSDARLRRSWSKGVVTYLLSATEKDLSFPTPKDALSVWFKPRLVRALAKEDLVTVGDLQACMTTRGAGWWRPIARVGEGKARVLEQWMRANAKHLGETVIPDDEPRGDLVEVRPGRPQWGLVPLEKMGSIVSDLDGHQGNNRNHAFCLIAAKNDLEAIQAYLYRYRGRKPTLRAYQRELERFLLWCVLERRTAMSSILTDDCEAYKDFLAKLPEHWCGPKARRLSDRWRPFVGSLEPESQRYAIQALRSFFDWLVAVRYLSGNPWVTVADPDVEQREVELHIEKALPQKLWETLAEEGGLLDRVCDGEKFCGPRETYATSPVAQYRLARAAVLLMGHTGIRRAEAAGATRDNLKPVVGRDKPIWELSVLGKRNKRRTVFLPLRVVEALQAHWADRGHNFEFGMHDLHLLAPVVIPPTPQARAKHQAAENEGSLKGVGFTPDSLARVVKVALQRLAADEAMPLSDAERSTIRAVAPHALRHTFATIAVAKEMATDALQRLMGHSSIDTTSIYVQAERERTIGEVEKLF